MNLDEIKELIILMRKNKIAEIDLEQEGSKVRIVASEPERAESPIMAPTYYMPHPPAEAYAPPKPAPVYEAAPSAPAPVAEPSAPVKEAIPASAVEIKSPMVGTFYRAPSPDSPPYVEVGQIIEKDSVIGIIEAMKLMNEIQSEVRGRILKVLVENGQPVEYNQPIFLVEKL